jgi:catechol 2,3-dioxygenase-like lactoylglutathione lyase family enzyme
VGDTLRRAAGTSGGATSDARRDQPPRLGDVGAGGGDIDEAYAEATRRGYEIVYPLTEETWGLRRFFVRDPDGNVINITSHRAE